MPWSHCDLPFILDNEDCPACGLTKAEWTIHFEKTRTFVVARRRASLTVLVVDTEDRPLQIAYRLDLADGRRREGTLDEAGEVTFKSLVLGTVRLTFPDYAAGAFNDPTPLQPFALEQGKHFLRLVLDPGKYVVEVEPFEPRIPTWEIEDPDLDEYQVEVEPCGPKAEPTWEIEDPDLDEYQVEVEPCELKAEPTWEIEEPDLDEYQIEVEPCELDAYQVEIQPVRR